MAAQGCGIQELDACVCVCVRLEDGTRKIYGWKGIGKLTRNYDYEVREFDGLNQEMNFRKCGYLTHE